MKIELLPGLPLFRRGTEGEVKVPTAQIKGRTEVRRFSVKYFSKLQVITAKHGNRYNHYQL